MTTAGPETPVRVEAHPWLSWPTWSARWAELADGGPDSGFFVGREWVETWIEIFGAQLRPKIAVFRSGDDVVGMSLVVFRTEFRGPVPVRRAYLNTNGEDENDDTCPEYNRILCVPGFETAVAAAFGAWLVTEGWDEFIASAMSDELVLPSLESCRMVRQEASSYYVDLTPAEATLDGFLSRLSRNTREQIRRSVRIYQERGDLRVEAPATVEQATAFLAELAALHQATWQSRGKPGVFASSRFVIFHKLLISKLFASGGIKLLRVLSGGTTIAVLYLFVRAGKVMFYQSGLEPSSDNKVKPGLVAHALAITECAAAGLREYDFLAGDSQYKKSLSTARRPIIWQVFQRRGVKLATITFLKQIRARLTKPRDSVGDRA